MVNATRLPVALGLALLSFLFSHAVASAQEGCRMPIDTAPDDHEAIPPCDGQPEAQPELIDRRIERCGWEVAKALIVRTDTVFLHGNRLPEEMVGYRSMHAVFVERILPHTVTNSDDLGDVVECLRDANTSARIDRLDNVQSYRTLPPAVTKSGEDAAVIQASIAADSVGFCPGADRWSDPFAIDDGRNPWNGPFRDCHYDSDSEGAVRFCDDIVQSEPIDDRTVALEDNGDIERSLGNNTPHPEDWIAISPHGDTIHYGWDSIALFTAPVGVGDRSQAMAEAWKRLGYRITKRGVNVEAVDRIDVPSTPAADSHPADWVAISHNNDTIDYRWDSLTLFAQPIDGHGRSIAEGLTRGGYHLEKLGGRAEIDTALFDHPRRDTVGRYITIRDVYPKSALYTSYTIPLIAPHGDGADSETFAPPHPILVISPVAQADPVATEENPPATSIATPPAPGLN